jgi:hypothetical protein
MPPKLDEFCNILSFKHGNPLPSSPGKLAEEFVAHSGLSSHPRFLELHSVIRQYGVSEIQGVDNLPSSLKGHHFSYRGGSYTIEYEADAWIGTIEFIMCHELYEIIQERYAALYPDYQIKSVPSICHDANKFSAALLMQAKVFCSAFYETGLDVIQLHHRLNKAYSSIAIRARDLVNHDTDPISVDFIIAIYERNTQEHPQEWGLARHRENFRVRCAVRSPGIKLGRRGVNYRSPRYPRHLIPKRGDKVTPGSIADLVCDTCQAVYLERVIGFDLWGWNELACLARPVLWFGKLAKIVLVAVRYQDRQLIQPQVDCISHYTKAISYQLI